MTELFNELKRRNLVVELSPPGRGQIVSHNLYPEWELDQVRKSVAASMSAMGDADEPTSSSNRQSPSNSVASPDSSRRIKEMESEMEQLKDSINDLQTRLSRLEKDLGVI